jgi:hypothetical protein
VRYLQGCCIQNIAVTAGWGYTRVVVVGGFASCNQSRENEIRGFTAPAHFSVHLHSISISPSTSTLHLHLTLQYSQSISPLIHPWPTCRSICQVCLGWCGRGRNGRHLLHEAAAGRKTFHQNHFDQGAVHRLPASIPTCPTWELPEPHD